MLTDNPRLGIYTNANFPGGYVEGSVRNVVVRTLSKISPVSTSASSAHSSHAHAIDGNIHTAWIATSGSPSEWIEIDLGSVRTIHKIRLLTEQTYTELTGHHVYIGLYPAPTAWATGFFDVTSTNQWLDYTFVGSQPNGRYIRIMTATSNSWRAWREIEVYE